MTEPFHLTAEVVERIQREAIERFGGTPGLRSRELLESALGGAQASFGGRSVFEDEVEIAPPDGKEWESLTPDVASGKLSREEATARLPELLAKR